jgi:hypothetical protein
VANRNQYDHASILRQAQELMKGKNPPETWRDMGRALGMDFNTLRQSLRREFGIEKMADIREAVGEKKNPRYTNNTEERETKDVEFGDDFINIICASRRMMSKEDIIDEFKIDLKEWKIDKYRIRTSEGYRKDRRVQWQVEDGKVVKGDVDDSGMMLVVPLYHLEVKLVRRTVEIRTRIALDDFIRDAKKNAPKISKVTYKKAPKGLWFEVDMPDIHIGKETWAEESGEDYNIEIARDVVLSTLDTLLGYARLYGIERILMPMGNDFFNVDNKYNTTTKGIPQQEDTRWSKTFREGRKLAVEMIDKCATLAPVHVIMIAGNHDEERSFYLGEVLDAWYSKSKNVTVDNRAIKRKYLKFGNNLIGFTHGAHEKIKQLPSIMPIEEPLLWAASKHREWHLGDKHHKQDLLNRTEDVDGVTIRLLRSLSATDTWHFDKGYIGAPRAAEGFLWDKVDGLIAPFKAILRSEK